MTKQTNSKKAKKLNQLDKLLEEHKDKFVTLQNGKIKCTVTGHEFMPSQQNLLSHLSSKSYKKASEAQFDITEYEDVLSTHKDNENFLFCRLTGAKVPKKKSAIQKHVNGKKFKSRFEEYKAQLQAEQEDQDIDEQEVEDDEDGDDIEDDQEGEQEEQQAEQQEEQEEEQQEEQEEEQPKKNGKKHNNKKQIKKQNHKKSQSKRFRQK